MNKKFKIKFIIFFFFVIVAFGVFVLSYNFLDNKVNDFFTKVLVNIKDKKASDNVVLVVIDGKSVNEKSWPWNRNLFSDIFYFLEKYSGAKAVVFNNLILYPDSYYPDSDKIFNQSLKNFDRLINTYIFLNSSMSGDVLPEDFVPVFNTKFNVKIIDKTTKNYKFSYNGIVNLPKDFLNNSKYFASSIIPEDNDEFVRNYMLISMYKDTIYPSVALSAYALSENINTFYLFDNFLCSDEKCKKIKIPIIYKKSRDYIGNNVYGLYSLINWYKPIDTYYSHKAYSAIDVLSSYNSIKEGKTPKISPETFKDKIVIIGLNADKNVWERLSETPVLKRQADIDVHACVIDNISDNSFIASTSIVNTIIITILFSILILRGFKNFKNNLFFGLNLSVLYLTYYLYEHVNNVYVPPFSPIITVLVVVLLKNIYIVMTTDYNAELVKQAMNKYLSKDIMKKEVLIDKTNLGGIRTIATILFVDIRNFTKIAENNSPGDVSSVLNEYFSVVEPIIAKYNGIVNKYMGDGLLAVFSGSAPEDNYALNAVKCGMEILSGVNELKEKFLLENKPRIDVGIGINTGEIFAGNIGTEERLEYTVIGDNVNLAYRIESYNQLLKTQFLISEYTYNYVKNYVEVVKLSQVSIKGKSNLIDIYEVLRINDND